MPIHVTCQGCGAQYVLADAAAGRRVRCKRCGVAFRVPSARDGLQLASAPEQELAKDAPPVGFKEDETVLSRAKPEPALPRPVSGDTSVIFEAGEFDELDVAAAEKPQKKKEETDREVGRPDNEAFSLGKRRKLKLKPGSRSFSDSARRKKDMEAAEERKRQQMQTIEIEERVIFSDFIRTPVAMIIMIAGLSIFLFVKLYIAAHLGEWLILRNMAVQLGIYFAATIPLGVAGVYLAGMAAGFKPTRPIARIVLLAWCVPPAIMAFGLLPGTDDALITAAVIAIPFTLLVFHLAHQQGVLRNLIAFIGMTVTPALGLYAIFYIGTAIEPGFVSTVTEYAHNIPPSRQSAIAEKQRQAQESPQQP